jgi:hypothetical protein
MSLEGGRKDMFKEMVSPERLTLFRLKELMEQAHTILELDPGPESEEDLKHMGPELRKGIQEADSAILKLRQVMEQAEGLGIEFTDDPAPTIVPKIADLVPQLEKAYDEAYVQLQALGRGFDRNE